MSNDSVEAPSSLLILSSPAPFNDSSPTPEASFSPLPPPPPPDAISQSLVVATPPSSIQVFPSPPLPPETPTSPPPPPSPSSSPPSNSSPPPSSPLVSHSPPPHQPTVSNSGPPPASPPPPLLLSSSKEQPPPSSSSPPTPAENNSPPVSGQSSLPPPSDQSSTTPPLPIGFVPPPATLDTVQAPPPPTEFLFPPAGQTSNSSTTPSTASPQAQSSSPSASTGSSSSHSSSSSSNVKQSSTTTATGVSNGSDNNTSKAVVGAVVAGVLLIAVITILLLAKKRKKRHDPYVAHYMPPTNIAVQTDRYNYYEQKAHVAGFSNAANYSYGWQPSISPDSYGSQQFSGDSGVIGGTKSHFSYEEVMEMTDGFSRQNIVGEGGFGCVYKGKVQDGRTVAVKQLKVGSGQGDREFKAEVEIISRVHHKHLVSLVGYCIADSQRLLLYDFVPNKTLEHHLHAKGLPLLDWPKRLKIAIGAAKGLAYLHEDCNPKIIHRDIKSANILLDDNFEAQVADFGLARLNDTSQTHVSTRVMGTFGYLAPEYASSGKLTDRSDVYSFGVVLLELITGRKPVDPTQPLGEESLVEWARPLLIRALETGDLSKIIDPRFEKRYVESEMIRMVETAAACVRHSAPKRPRMVQVMRALDSEEMSDLTNGVKYGQSTAYDSGQYDEDIIKFRRMALSSDDSSEFGTRSGGYSTEVSHGPKFSNFTSEEYETKAMRDSSNRRFADNRRNI